MTARTIAALALAAAATFMAAPAQADTAGDFTSPVFAAASGRHVDRVDAFSSNWYQIDIFAGQRLDFELAGDGDTDLDLWIYDADGRVVVRDINPTDLAAVYVTSNFDTTLQVEVRNLGAVWNQFEIVWY